MLTELWWGISSYGKWGVATERSCAGGGFASCLPSRLRQLGWSFIGSMAGINSVNLYTQARGCCEHPLFCASSVAGLSLRFMFQGSLLSFCATGWSGSCPVSNSRSGRRKNDLDETTM